MSARETVVRRVDGDAGELRFEVEIAGGRRELWFRSEAPITDRADPAVPAVLLPAMMVGAPLRFADPIDPVLLRQVPDVVGLLASWRWLWSHLGYGMPQPIEVQAPVAEHRPRATVDEATFFSGGVDGFFTALEVPEVTRLIYVGGLDTRLDHPAAPAIRSAIEGAAEALGMPLVTVETNAREFTEEFASYLGYFGSALAAVAMLLEPEIARVQIASSSTYGEMVPNGSHPLLDALWRTSAVEIRNHGTWIDRIGKLERIAKSEAARSSLRVCWHNPEAGLNCGRCDKCLRTMAMLDVVGLLDRFETFPDELDLDAVAGLDLVIPTSGESWRLLRAVAERRGARPELIEAIEACLDTEREWVPDTRGDPFWALERAEAKLAERDAALAAREATLREVMGSSSWRLTAPMRRVRRALRVGRASRS